MPKINKKEYKVLKGLDDKWEWIARDKNRCLYVFTGKPVKKYGPLLYWGTEGFLSFELFDEKDLFQFIQWENEEPYSIQKLIHDYEYKTGIFDWATAFQSALHSESEEAEVKNIEWLKEEVLGLRNNGNGETNQTAVEREIGRLQKWAWNNCVDRVYELIDQLDGPEVLSQKWIEFNTWTNHYVGDPFVYVGDLQNILVPKQELPVIPQFVAEWIEEMKQDERPLYSVMSSLMNKTNHEWAVWKNANKDFSEIMAQAWLDGYEVEEEQKYYVSERDEEYGGFWFLSKNNNGNISIGVSRDWSEVDWDRLKLTEKEIKDYDERYWPFRKTVEELEE